MKLIGNILASFVLSLAGLLIAQNALDGVTLTSSISGIALTALLFTLIYILVLPIARFIFKPFIILTFGLLSFVFNAGALWILDIYATTLTIDSLSALVYTTGILTLLHAFLYPLLRRLW